MATISNKLYWPLRNFILGTLSLWGFDSSAINHPPTVELSAPIIIEILEGPHLNVNEIDFFYKQNIFNNEQVLNAFDWNLSGEVSDEKDSLKSISNLVDFRYRRNRSTLILSKHYRMGLTTTLSFNSIFQNAEILPSRALIMPPENLYSETLTLTIEENLWRNSLGKADQSLGKYIENSNEASLIRKQIQNKEMILNGLKLYWQAFLACEILKSSQETVARYKKLVTAINKKAKFNFSSPGELAQANAELQGKQQSLFTAETSCLNAKSSLVLYLNLNPDVEIHFSIPSDPSPPHFEQLPNPEKIDKFLLAQLQFEAAHEQTVVFDSQQHPDISVFAKASSSGVDSNQENAIADMTKFKSPFYSVGIKFDYSWGSDTGKKRSQLAHIERDLAAAKLTRTKQTVAEELKLTSQRWQKNYLIFLSIQNQKKLRNQAVEELNKSYSQGRIDISQLIESINRLHETNLRWTEFLTELHQNEMTWHYLIK